MEKGNSSLDIQVTLDGQEKLLVYLTGKITDTETSSLLVEQVSAQLSEERNRVFISLENLNYINSNGLNSLIALLTKSRTRGGDLTLCNVNEKVSKLLLITKLNTVFNIEDSIENALENTIHTNEK